jgi:acetyl esterase
MTQRSLRQRVEGRALQTILGLPPAVAARLAGAPVTRDSYTLDAQTQMVLALHRLTGKKLTHELPLTAARVELERSATLLPSTAPPLASVEELSLSGPACPIPVRVYRPHGATRPAPAMVYFHGGGFALGSLDSHDGVCRALAAGARCVVAAVDYRLAPEHRFPAAVEDAVAAFREVAARASALGLDAARLAVGGDSAGGNLAAVVTQETRADAVRPCFQVLLYPAVDMTLSFASIDTLSDGFILERASIDWYLARYLPAGQDRRDPRASPLHAASLAGLPPALVVTAGFDPLRDEGQAYAEKLAAAGVRVALRCYGGLIHGFLHLAGPVHAANEALADVVAALESALAPAQKYA